MDRSPAVSPATGGVFGTSPLVPGLLPLSNSFGSDLDALLSDDDDDSLALAAAFNASSLGSPGSGKPSAVAGTVAAQLQPRDLRDFAEQDEDDLSRDFAGLELNADAVLNVQKVGAGADWDENIDDHFNEILEEMGKESSESIELNKAFNRLIGLLHPSYEEETILEACDSLGKLLEAHPEQVRDLLSSRGVIPIMELMELPNTSVLHGLLRLLNQVVARDNIPFQRAVSLVGLIPAVLEFSQPGCPAPLRLEAADFIRSLSLGNPQVTQMFIACGGLPVLVGFLFEDYELNRLLVRNALDCVEHILRSPELTVGNQRNDFCRLLCKFGVVQPLVQKLEQLLESENKDDLQYVDRIGGLLYLLCQQDALVKLNFGSPEVLGPLLRMLPKLESTSLVLILKALLTLAAYTDPRSIARGQGVAPSIVAALEGAGAAAALVRFLGHPLQEVQSLTIQTLYFFVRVNANRLEQAAVAGIVPHLQRMIREQHPLRQFAYDILFALPSAGKRLVNLNIVVLLSCSADFSAVVSSFRWECCFDNYFRCLETKK